MENSINTLPYGQVLVFLLIGAFFRVGFYLITTYGIPVIRKNRQSIGLYWIRVQIISWAIYLLLFFSTVFKENPYLTLAITGLILGIGWSFWINYFAGVIIKFTNQFKVNDRISMDIATGKIQAIKTTFTEMTNSQGELIVIPNKKLKNAVLKHLNQKNASNTSAFKLVGDFTYNQVVTYAYNCPYFTANQPIRVTQNQSKDFEIKAVLLDESFKEEAAAYFERMPQSIPY